MSDGPLTSTQLFAIRDSLLEAAKRDCEAAIHIADNRGDNRGHLGAAAARRELAFTVDTIARRSVDAEHKAAGQKLGGHG